MAHNGLPLPPAWLSAPRKDQHKMMRKALLSTCKNEVLTDPKYSILLGGLLAESVLNKGQTLLRDMCDRLLGGKYGQANELALIACKYGLEIIVFANGTQEWIQKLTGTHQQQRTIALRWCRETTHYDWLKRTNPDEPERANPSPVLLTLGPHSTDADTPPPPTPSQESNRAGQPKNNFSHCLTSGNGAEKDSPATPAKCNRPGSLESGLNHRNTDNLPPPTTKESYGSRQPQHNSSSYSDSDNTEISDSPIDSDEPSEEVIYSQGPSKVEDVYMDYNWDLGRFVEYNSPLKGKAILSPDNNSSHWNRKNNSSVMTNNHSPRRDETKNQDKKSR